MHDLVPAPANPHVLPRPAPLLVGACPHFLPVQGVGYGISVAAFFVYQRIKMRQIAAESAAKLGGGGGAAVAANSSSKAGPGGELLVLRGSDEPRTVDEADATADHPRGTIRVRLHGPCCAPRRLRLCTGF